MKRLAIITAFILVWGVVPKLQAQKEGIKFQLEKRMVLSSVPSASGSYFNGKKLYVTGDNTAWLFVFSQRFRLKDKILLWPNGVGDSIIPKAVKPDFESAAVIGQNLYIFGSGSKSPQRDVMAMVSWHGSQPTVNLFSMKEFYQKMRDIAGLKPDALNLEGAAADKDFLYLFDRENNLVFRFLLSDFLNYLEKQGLCPVPTFWQIKLPALHNMEAGISGASFTRDGKRILFTASVENTNDTYHDGDILGSFIGIIDPYALKNGYKPATVLIKEKGAALPVKVESVTVTKTNKTGVEVILVTDSDGGVSELLEGTLRF